jgi:hypothetical protein
MIIESPGRVAHALMRDLNLLTPVLLILTYTCATRHGALSVFFTSYNLACKGLESTIMKNGEELKISSMKNTSDHECGRDW